MAVSPSASYSITVRLEIRNKPGMLGRVASVIGEAGGDMKLAAARALAACVGRSELGEEYIIPSVFNKGVAPAVADGVARSAQATGVARRRRRLDLSEIQ